MRMEELIIFVVILIGVVEIMREMRKSDLWASLRGFWIISDFPGDLFGGLSLSSQMLTIFVIRYIWLLFSWIAKF